MPAKAKEPTIPAARTRIGSAVLIIPTLRPEMIFVAAPLMLCLAIIFCDHTHQCSHNKSYYHRHENISRCKPLAMYIEVGRNNFLNQKIRCNCSEYDSTKVPDVQCALR